MQKKKKKLWYLCLFILWLPTLVCSKDHGNPANDLVDIINKNRTSHKLHKLNNNPGLGCIALQYAESCKTNCTNNNTVNCKPSEDDFTEIFAPNCGVELPTFGTITARIIGCGRKYIDPSIAFSEVLVRDKHSVSVLSNRSHSEVGVGIVGVRKGPLFWCVLFGNGDKNSSFVLENRGLGIKQKRGCFSGSSFACSEGGNFASWLSRESTGKRNSAELFGSASFTLQHGGFRKSFGDLTRLDARVDISSASALAKMVLGPIAFRVDSRFRLDSSLVKKGSQIEDYLLSLTYSFRALDSGKAVFWYSPKRKEGMAELRLYEF